MRHGDDGTVSELLPNALLDKSVRLEVDGGRCFVENQDPGSMQQSPGQAYLLALTKAIKNK